MYYAISSVSDYLKTDLLMPEISSRIRAWKGGFLSILYSPKSCLFIFSDSEWNMCSLNSYPSFFYYQRFKNAPQNITTDQMPHSARMCHRFTETCLCKWKMCTGWGWWFGSNIALTRLWGVAHVIVVGKLFNLMQYHSDPEVSEVSICNNHLMGHKPVL